MFLFEKIRLPCYLFERQDPHSQAWQRLKMSQKCQNHQEARLVLWCGSTLTPTIMLTANGRGADKCTPEMEITALLKYVSTPTNTVQNSKALIICEANCKNSENKVSVPRLCQRQFVSSQNKPQGAAISSEKQIWKLRQYSAEGFKNSVPAICLTKAVQCLGWNVGTI